LRRQLLSVDGDADALAVVIANGSRGTAGRFREFLVGESYGVPSPRWRTRSPADKVLACAADHDPRRCSICQFRLAPSQSTAGDAQLPSMAATVMETKRRSTAMRARSRNYASGEYLRDLMRARRDAEAIEHMTPRVAAFTALMPSR
jgi:hypothetical protein